MGGWTCTYSAGSKKRERWQCHHENMLQHSINARVKIKRTKILLFPRKQKFFAKNWTQFESFCCGYAIHCLDHRPITHYKSISRACEQGQKHGCTLRAILFPRNFILSHSFVFRLSHEATERNNVPPCTRGWCAIIMKGLKRSHSMGLLFKSCDGCARGRGCFASVPSNYISLPAKLGE